MARDTFVGKGKHILGKHSVKHTCGHSAIYIAVPPKLDIEISGEQRAYKAAILEHRRAAVRRLCDDCSKEVQ